MSVNVNECRKWQMKFLSIMKSWQCSNVFTWRISVNICFCSSSINCYVPLNCCQSPSSLGLGDLCALDDDLPILWSVLLEKASEIISKSVWLIFVQRIDIILKQKRPCNKVVFFFSLKAVKNRKEIDITLTNTDQSSLDLRSIVKFGCSSTFTWDSKPTWNITYNRKS